MTLTNSTFIAGAIIANSGGPFVSSSPADLDTLKQRIKLDDPDFTYPNTGDFYAGGAIVEDLKGIFEEASLSGGDSQNIIVVGDSDGVIHVGNTIRIVDSWTGIVTLDNRGNSANALPEFYIVNVTGGNASRVNIRDS